jgi:cytidylate kinase
MSEPDLKIAIVGPCAAGKTTLIAGLLEQGIPARQIAQEHSFVGDMWERMAKADVLIYLNASYETCTRRKSLNWTQKEYDEQVRRLKHARENCDLEIQTDNLSADQVLAIAANHLKSALLPR